MGSLCGCNETTDKPAGATMGPAASPTSDKCAQLETKMSHAGPAETADKTRKEMFQKTKNDMVKACRDGTKYDPCARAPIVAMMESLNNPLLATMETENQKLWDSAIEECNKTDASGELSLYWVAI